jgi:hypothetical protein
MTDPQYIVIDEASELPSTAAISADLDRLFRENGIPREMLDQAQATRRDRHGPGPSPS